MLRTSSLRLGLICLLAGTSNARADGAPEAVLTCTEYVSFRSVRQSLEVSGPTVTAQIDFDAAGKPTRTSAKWRPEQRQLVYHSGTVMFLMLLGMSFSGGDAERIGTPGPFLAEILVLPKTPRDLAPYSELRRRIAGYSVEASYDDGPWQHLELTETHIDPKATKVPSLTVTIPQPAPGSRKLHLRTRDGTSAVLLEYEYDLTNIATRDRLYATAYRNALRMIDTPKLCNPIKRP